MAQTPAAESGLTFERDRPLARWSTLRVGGPAAWSVQARSSAELALAVTVATERNLPWRILGSGSNVLVSDAGVGGVVILNAARAVLGKAVRGEELRVRVESGAPLAGLARRLAREGWAGLEWGCGIPGTVGGAVVGNAGAHGGEIKDALVSATLLDNGNERSVAVTELGYGYRTSALARSPAPMPVLTAEFRLHRAAAAECLGKIAEYERWRRAHQPREHSAGSMFKNPPGEAAGRLIDAAGLKGAQRGGAQISTRHANFFVTQPGATSADIVALIQLARRTVQAQFGIVLELEIIPLGTWERDPRYVDDARRTPPARPEPHHHTPIGSCGSGGPPLPPSCASGASVGGSR